MELKERQDICQDVAISLWQKSILSVEEEYERQQEVLMVGDTCIGTLGNFSASIGKAKSKKTFNLSALVASALTDHPVLCYSAHFPEDKRNILYVDTEQSTYHCQRVMKRILRLAGLPESHDEPRLQFLALRKNTPEERLAIADAAIRHTDNLGLVIIDGVRDLIYDINSPTEATCIISKLMQWTDEHQIHLHTVLHQNKGDDNARGHIGTELNNKAETVMLVEKDKTDSDISVAEAVHIRSMEFEPFAFRINEQSLPELITDYKPTTGKVGRPTKEPFDPYRDISEATHREALDMVFANGSIESYKNLIKALLDGYGKVGMKLNYNKAVTLATFLRNKRMMVLENRAYTYKPDFYY